MLQHHPQSFIRRVNQSVPLPLWCQLNTVKTPTEQVLRSSLLQPCCHHVALTPSGLMSAQEGILSYPYCPTPCVNAPSCWVSAMWRNPLCPGIGVQSTKPPADQWSLQPANTQEDWRGSQPAEINQSAKSPSPTTGQACVASTYCGCFVRGQTRTWSNSCFPVVLGWMANSSSASIVVTLTLIWIEHKENNVHDHEWHGSVKNGGIY